MAEANTHQRSSAVPGLAVIGLFLVGIEAMLLAVLAGVACNFIGGGVCLIAAALSFGIVGCISFL